MKLFGLRSYSPRKGIRVYLLEEKVVSLEGVLRHSLICAGRSGEELEFSVDPESRFLDMRLLGPGAPEGVQRGIVCYDDPAAASEFARESVEIVMRPESEPRGRRRLRSWRPLGQGQGRPVQAEDLPSNFMDSGFLRDLVNLRRMGAGDAFATTPGTPQLVAERRVDYAGQRIPRRVFAAALEPGCLAWFDGVRHGMVASVRDLPAELQRELGEEGRPLREGRLTNLLPEPALHPLFLLRVPGRREAEAILGTGEPPPATRREPLFLLDTREPVPLPEGLPQVLDPVEALALAMRTPEDLYLPGEPPGFLSRLEEEATWRVALRWGP